MCPRLVLHDFCERFSADSLQLAVKATAFYSACPNVCLRRSLVPSMMSPPWPRCENFVFESIVGQEKRYVRARYVEHDSQGLAALEW